MALDRVRPRVFLSHSHEDTDYCRIVASRLRQRGIDVYFYEDDPRPGMIQDIIEQELRSRECFVVLVSPSAMESNWVKQEVLLAQELERRHYLRMFLPVLAAPVDIPLRLALYKRIQDAGGRPVTALEASERILLALPRDYTTARQPSGSYELGISEHHFPQGLPQLGFAAYTLHGVELILPPMREVPAGTFLMGSDPAADGAAFDDEMPQNAVHVEHFEIAQFPVTVAEYDCFVRNGGHEPSLLSRDKAWQEQLEDLTCPVVNVSFRNAAAYAEWLARHTGDMWQLPTEAQWEKAARWEQAQQVSLLYPWGMTFDETRCNAERSGNGALTRVGEYPSGTSPFGAEDMAGNVWEWTRSRHKRYPYVATDGRESRGDFGRWVLRGGSWTSTAAEARTANRRTVGVINALAADEYGFRLARVPRFQ